MIYMTFAMVTRRNHNIYKSSKRNEQRFEFFKHRAKCWLNQVKFLTIVDLTFTLLCFQNIFSDFQSCNKILFAFRANEIHQKANSIVFLEKTISQKKDAVFNFPRNLKVFFEWFYQISSWQKLLESRCQMIMKVKRFPVHILNREVCHHI